MDVSVEIEAEEQRIRPTASEVERLLADTKLVRELTGWEAHVTLEQGLERTIAWFRENFSLYRTGVYTI
jgi:UDP-glucose 4-epimerase